MNRKSFLKTSTAGIFSLFLPKISSAQSRRGEFPAFQQEVVDVFKNTDRDIFCIFPRGCGKTFLLKYLYELINPPNPNYFKVDKYPVCRSRAYCSEFPEIYYLDEMLELGYRDEFFHELYAVGNYRKQKAHRTVTISTPNYGRYDTFNSSYHELPPDGPESSVFCRRILKIISEESDTFISVKNFDEIGNDIYSDQFIKEKKANITLNPKLEAEYMCRDFLNL